MTTNSTFRPPSQPLSFPFQTFAKLSPLAFLEAHLSCDPPIRPSGRHPTQARTPTSHSSSLTHASGSAVVRVGSTSVVCGVRAEILYVRDIADYTARNIPPPSYTKNDTQEERDKNGANSGEARNRRREDADEMARLNLVVPNIELSTGCSPAHLPGGPPSTLAQTLTQRTLTLLHTSQILNLSDFRIWHTPSPTDSLSASSDDKMDISATESNPPISTKDGRPISTKDGSDTAPEIKAFWTLYIDIIFISLDGNPFDAAWSALLAALLDTKLPQATYDLDSNMILCSPLASLAHPLRLRSFPIPLSFGVFSSSSSSSSSSASKSKKAIILVDMDSFEEDICLEKGTVVVSGDNGVVVGLEKIGGGMLRGRDLKMLVELAGARWREWSGVLG